LGHSPEDRDHEGQLKGSGGDGFNGASFANNGEIIIPGGDLVVNDAP
jgi:hypothetical protein